MSLTTIDLPSRLSAVERLAWQKTLFAPQLNSYDLMKLGGRTAAGAPALRVHRNHAFETVATALAPFLQFGDIALRPELGDYDDSLTFASEGAACELLWLDFGRYEALDDAALREWLIGRLRALRSQTAAPIVVASPIARHARTGLRAALETWAQSTPSAALLDLAPIERRLGAAFLDEERMALTGTRLSAQACLQAARMLAFEVLPLFFGEPLKAIAVDLDNTLYDGTLGEDGVAGVRLNPAHAALQAQLAEWASRGVLLTVVSRNQPADVEALFAQRQDFALRAEHIAAWEVSWGLKSDAVLRACERFRIAPEAMLLMDDNAGELTEAAFRAPGLRLLFAGDGPEQTARALEGYPGLPRGAVAFAGRAADLKASAERAEFARGATDPMAYFGELRVELAFAANRPEDLARMTELSRKTNQFNLALKRLNEAEAATYLAAPDRQAVHARLRDRLSDSGSVAALFARLDGEVLVVDELCISCRAMGRQLEDLMVGEMVRHAQRDLGARRIAFEFAEGPRNAPARRWLESFAGRSLNATAGRLELDALPPRRDLPVTLRWTTE